MVPSGENLTDSGSSLDLQSPAKTLVKAGNRGVDRLLREIGDPTALINVVAANGRYKESETDVHLRAQRDKGVRL